VKGIVAKADIINYYFQDLFLKAWSLKGRRGKKNTSSGGIQTRDFDPQPGDNHLATSHSYYGSVSVLAKL